MSQIFKDVTGSPSVATNFVTDSGTAIPAANIINIVTPGGGTQGISTSGSGNTITITVSTATLTGTGTTVGATTADIITVTPTDLKSFSIQSLVSGYDTANNQMIGGELLGTGRKSTTVTIVGTPDKTSEADSGLSTASYDLVASGATFVVRVTGVAGRTIDWGAKLNYVSSP